MTSSSMGTGSDATCIQLPSPTPQPRGLFMTPWERQMAFTDFLEIFYGSRDEATTGGHRLVPYMQRQNSNLTEEFAALLEDIDREMPLFAEAFGAPPEAINMWFGDSRSNTSFHKESHPQNGSVSAMFFTQYFPP